MRPVVGLLLTALGLIMVAGCALPGSSSRGTEGFAFQSKRSSGNLDVGSEHRLTFKKPRSASLAMDDSARQETHSAASRRPQATSETSDGHNSTSAFTAGHSSDPSLEPRNSSTSPQLSFAEVTDENSETAEISLVSHVELKERNSNPIQLQGLDVDDGKMSEAPSKPLVSPWDQNSDRTKKSESRPATIDRQPLSDPSPRKSAGTAIDNRQSPSGLTRTPQQAPTEVLKQPSRGGGLQQTSATASSTLTWQAQLDQLIARLEQDLAGQPADQPNESHFESLRKQAHLRLLYLIAERQEDALTAIPHASTVQQEFWQQMIWAMSNSLDAEQFPDSDERAAQTLTPLSSALRQIREEAPLSIKNMSFCRKISYFGNYDRFPRNEFTPGYEVLLYTEIENFTSTPTVDGEYRTSLKSLMEITDTSGKVVWTKGFPSTEDFCRNPRRDYFHNYQFHIPEDLPIGSYSLKLTIVDELSHKRVSSSLGFVLK